MLPPKSHHIDTEYRRSFKKSRFACSATTYQDNLDFRTEQKRRFVVHNPEPFAWDPEDLESDSSSDRNCEDLGRSFNPLTHTQYKHEKLNRLYEKRMNGEKEVVGSKEVGRKSNGGEVQRVSTHDASRRRESGDEREREREHEREGERRGHRVETDEEEYDGESGSESDASSVVHIIEPEFVKEPAKRTSSARPEKATWMTKSANKHTQTDRGGKHQVEKKSSRAPFAPYGYEANVTETGKKLTHNIRAAREIYPSALRALRNRRTTTPTGQPIHSRGKHGQPSARLTSSEPVRIFVHSDNFDDPDWVTEYDQNFQLYNPSEYKKRPDSARVHARELLAQPSGKTRIQTRR